MHTSELNKLTEMLAKAKEGEIQDRIKNVASILSVKVSEAICPTNDILAPIVVVVLEKYRDALEQRLTPSGKEFVSLLKHEMNTITISNIPPRETGVEQ